MTQWDDVIKEVNDFELAPPSPDATYADWLKAWGEAITLLLKVSHAADHLATREDP